MARRFTCSPCAARSSTLACSRCRRVVVVTSNSGRGSAPAGAEHGTPSITPVRCSSHQRARSCTSGGSSLNSAVGGNAPRARRPVGPSNAGSANSAPSATAIGLRPAAVRYTVPASSPPTSQTCPSKRTRSPTRTVPARVIGVLVAQGSPCSVAWSVGRPRAHPTRADGTGRGEPPPDPRRHGQACPRSGHGT
jgi:hypothetical protein